MKRLIALLLVMILLTSCSHGEEEHTQEPVNFKAQYETLSNTEGIRYLLREHIMGDYNNGLVSYYGIEDIPDGTYPHPDWHGLGYHSLNGVRLDDHEGGVLYAYTFVEAEEADDAGGSVRHRYISEDDDGNVISTVGRISLGSHSPGCVISCISFDDFGNGERVTSFYAGAPDGTASDLCILKQYEEGDTDKCLLIRIPVSEIGMGVRGLRFLNDNVGFMLSGFVDGFKESPVIYVTVDGGRVWNSMDTSQLIYPDYFELYRTCCLEMYGDLIQVRVQCRWKEPRTVQEQDEMRILPYTEPYYIISEDGGKTWTGYLREGDRVFSPHFEKVYGFTPVTRTVEIDIDPDGRIITGQADEFRIPAEEFSAYYPIS